MTIEDFIARFSAGMATMENAHPVVARQRYDQLCQTFAPPNPAGIAIFDEVQEHIALRHFLPASPKPGRVLYIHGGGFTLGSNNSHHGIAANLAKRLKRHVVSIQYCLAPDVDYQHMLADCLSVAETLRPNAIVGDSAGGRLAMDLTPLLNSPTLLGLIYPPVDGLNAHAIGESAPLLSRRDVMSIIPYYSSHRSNSETLLPAEYIEVLSVEHDPLTEPLETAITHWRHQGAQVGYRCAPNMVHAALHAHADLPEMQNAWQDFCQALDQRLT
ncbi:MAG: lipolytic protein [Halomonas sp.]|nr:lipolytic protein [Halomonas sp.]